MPSKTRPGSHTVARSWTVNGGRFGLAWFRVEFYISLTPSVMMALSPVSFPRARRIEEKPMPTSLDKRRAALKGLPGNHGLSEMTIVRIDALGDEETYNNALGDSDAPPTDNEQLDTATRRRRSSFRSHQTEDLSKSDTDHAWTAWEFGPRPEKHLHAIGVIIMTFSQLERSVESLFLNFAQKHSIPPALSHEYYLSLPEGQKDQAMLRLFSDLEKDNTIKNLVKNLLDCLAWSRDCRNKIAHSEQYPAAFGHDKSLFYFQKRVGKKTIESLYFSLDLHQLRYVADQMREHVKRSAELDIYLRIRGHDKSQLNRVYWQFLSKQLPDPLAVPSGLQVKDKPG